LPDKKWLQDMIHSLKPAHEIFVGHQADKNAFSISWKIPLGRKCCILIFLFIFNDQSGNCPKIYPPALLKQKRRGFFTKKQKERGDEEDNRLALKVKRIQSQKEKYHAEFKRLMAKQEKIEKIRIQKKEKEQKMDMEIKSIPRDRELNKEIQLPS